MGNMKSLDIERGNFFFSRQNYLECLIGFAAQEQKGVGGELGDKESLCLMQRISQESRAP